jgi:putative transposase
MKLNWFYFLLHNKFAHIRRDKLHKISTILSKNHAIIVLEDLKIGNMTI